MTGCSKGGGSMPVWAGLGTSMDEWMVLEGCS